MMFKHALRTALFAICSVLVTPFAQAQNELTDKHLQEIEKLKAPIRTKIHQIMDKDHPGLRAQYDAEVASIGKLKDRKEQNEGLKKLEGKYLPAFESAYKKAKVNEKDFAAKVAKIIPKGTPYKIGKFLSIECTYKRGSQPNPSPTCTDLNPEFKVMNKEHNAFGFVYFRDKRFFTESGGFLIPSPGTAEGYLGSNLEIAKNKTLANITVTMKDYTMDLFAIACLGISYTEAEFGVRLQGPGVDASQYFLKKKLVAPVIWFSNVTMAGENSDFYALINFHSSGGSHKVQAYSKCKTVVGMAATADSHTNIELKQIKVCTE